MDSLLLRGSHTGYLLHISKWMAATPLSWTSYMTNGLLQTLYFALWRYWKWIIHLYLSILSHYKLIPSFFPGRSSSTPLFTLVIHWAVRLFNTRCNNTLHKKKKFFHLLFIVLFLATAHPTLSWAKSHLLFSNAWQQNNNNNKLLVL